MPCSAADRHKVPGHKFLDNGVTAHRGNSGDHPENTIPAFQSGIDVGAAIRITNKHGFESLVLDHAGVTTEKVQKIKAAQLEAGAWTVNDLALMKRLFAVGVERLYTDYPSVALGVKGK